MPLINPDLSEAADFAPIPDGTYPGKIVSCDFQLSKENQKPMLKIGAELTVDGKTRKRTIYVLTSGAGAFMFEQLLRACHFDEYADQLKNPDVAHPGFDSDQFLNQTLQFVVVPEIRKDNGEMSDRVSRFLKN